MKKSCKIGRHLKHRSLCFVVQNAISLCVYFSELICTRKLLRDLLCADPGQQSPNTANDYQLEKLKMDSFSSYVTVLGAPFYWVQWICGVNYMPDEQTIISNPDASLSVKHFENVLRKIKSRLKSRISLQKQLNSLGSFCLV